ncbi:TPA: hypothetical protein SML50_001513 [Serratia fonticola]|nr:hypothetical protein [Serratia fonticola]
MSKLRCFSDGKTVTEIKVDCDSSGLQARRSPMSFSISPTEYVEFALPIATGVIGVLVAYIKRGKKLRIDYYENGKIKTVDSANTSHSDIEKVLEKLSQHQTNNEG